MDDYCLKNEHHLYGQAYCWTGGVCFHKKLSSCHKCVVCLLDLLHIFKCIPEIFYLKSRYYEP